jgi:adenylosuccinate synthase
MPLVVIVGAQWGDEGKGKIVDLLAEKAKVVARFSGGSNAGHTVCNPYGEFRLHLIPSGIFYPHTICIIGNGVVVSPGVLLEELDQLGAQGVDTSRLFISNRAHLVMPYHTLLDELEEKAKGSKALGTTRSGIGPAYMDKAARLGIRAGDLLHGKELRHRLQLALDQKNPILTKVYGAPPLSLDEIYDQYSRYGERLAPLIGETGPLIEQALGKGELVLLEGAQGALLDIDFGTYPYVTSSSPVAAGAFVGLGLSPFTSKVDGILGVMKPYTTRVGAGPMPTELKDETGELIRQVGHEYGATTGRPRRCGWFDAVAARFSTHINGLSGVALTRLDVLDGFESIKICTAYKRNRETINQFPSSSTVLEECQPVYEEVPGWQCSTNALRRFEDLPPAAQSYVRRLEGIVGCPTDIVSVGPRREQTIMVRPIP